MNTCQLHSEYCDTAALVLLMCCAVCKSVVDVVFAVDGSVVVGTENFQKSLEFLRRLAASLNIDGGNRLAVLSFADEVDFRFHLDDLHSVDAVQDALSINYA